jgi:predicted flap endonuclease-1-like 5' DNA nuclease
MNRLLRQVMLFVLSLAASVGVGWVLLEGERLWKAEQQQPSMKLSNSGDELTVIVGIGPVYAHALYALGIRTFTELADQNPDELAQRMEVNVSPERIRHEDWIGQARQLSQG